MYVRLRSALSICDTCPAFLVTNSSYMPSHCGGNDSICPRLGRDDGFASGLASFDGAGIVMVQNRRLAGAGAVCGRGGPSYVA